MLASLFDYRLPENRIAQEPIRPRDHSRLLALNRETGATRHCHFYEIGEFLKPGDLLVVNDSKVFKARLRGWLSAIGYSLPRAEHRGPSAAQKDPTESSRDSARDRRKPKAESRIELFLLRPEAEGTWMALAKPGKRLAPGSAIAFEGGASCRVIEKREDGTVRVDFERTPDDVFALANAIGEVPVPPYVSRAPDDAGDYQTVYAAQTGSVAAPTAGFHFTPELIASLKSKGIRFASVTLHVGLGTFRPMKSATLEEHVMHEEWISISEETMNAIAETKQNGGGVVAVGTTTVRALESCGLPASRSPLPASQFTNLFITPGYRFKLVDALITNFHLPKSTLLVLVSAFAGEHHADADEGRKMILRAYEEAIKEGYRFYSFGDAMIIFSSRTA